MIGVGSAPRGGVAHGGRATERDCWIALALVPGIGPAGFAQLVRHFGTAAEAFAAGPSGLAAIGRGAPESAAGFAQLATTGARAVVRRLGERTAAHGGRVVAAVDEAYPPALLTLDPRPPLLFVVGDGAAFMEQAVAVVGTRRASGYGLAAATDIGDELARAGVVVVSGLALGIDGAAHRAAVRAGGRSIAVLPSPIDRIYPPRHRGLATEIARSGGALVTEIPVGGRVGRPDFARRNRIIAGLSRAVVVVEAPDRSGALLTVAAARSAGIDVYAVPGQIDAMASRGCNRLIADGDASVVTSAAALVHGIGLRRADRPPVTAALSEVEGQVMRRLLERSGSIEELVDRTGQPPASVAGALTLLEARGLVNTFGGATFHPTLVARRLGGVV